MSWNQLKQSFLKRCGPSLVIISVLSAIAIPLAITIGLSPPAVSTWTRIPIGAEVTGSLSAQTGQAVQIASSGKRIDGTVDSFFFAARPIPVGGKVEAKINDPGGSAAAGIMVRHELTPDAPNLFFGLSATDSTPYISWRRSKRGETEILDLSNLATAATPIQATSWLRLIPEQSTVYAYYSNDGSQWIPIAAIDFPMPARVFAGAAAASGDSNTTTTATFGDIRFDFSSGYRVEITQQPGDAANVVENGTWTTITESPGERAVDGTYLADEGGPAAGKAPGTSIDFNPAVTITGTYEVYAHYGAGPDRADAVPVTVEYFDEADTIANYASEGGTPEYLSSDFYEEYGANYYYQQLIDYYTTYEHVWESWYYYDTGEEVTNEYDTYYETADPARTDTLTFDETAGGQGVWVHLGTWFFDADKPAENLIAIGNNDDGLVTFDALRLLGVAWPDTDSDGMADWFELEHYTDRTAMDPSGSDDGDTLDNASEYAAHSDPFLDDTDGDTLVDDSDTGGTAPYLADSDADGLDDGMEINGLVDVNQGGVTTQISLTGADWDEDDDLLPDGYEANNDLDPQDEADGNADADNDGLTRGQEWLLGTEHENPYSDTDGLDDGAEVLIHETDPLNPDTDGDGHFDDVEVTAGSDPLDPASVPGDSGGSGGGDPGDDPADPPAELPWVPTINIGQVAVDSDGDGFTDSEERAAGTDPDETGSAPAAPGTDADGDRIDDGWESTHNLDPADPRDADIDFDGDGLTSFQEYLQNTDPRSPAQIVNQLVSDSAGVINGDIRWDGFATGDTTNIAWSNGAFTTTSDTPATPWEPDTSTPALLNPVQQTFDQTEIGITVGTHRDPATDGNLNRVFFHAHDGDTDTDDTVDLGFPAPGVGATSVAANNVGQVAAMGTDGQVYLYENQAWTAAGTFTLEDIADDGGILGLIPNPAHDPAADPTTEPNWVPPMKFVLWKDGTETEIAISDDLYSDTMFTVFAGSHSMNARGDIVIDGFDLESRQMTVSIYQNGKRTHQTVYTDDATIAGTEDTILTSALSRHALAEIDLQDAFESSAIIAPAGELFQGGDPEFGSDLGDLTFSGFFLNREYDYNGETDEYFENTYAVHIGAPDTDGDLIPDDWENYHGLDPDSASDALLDNDFDGLINLREFYLNTDPNLFLDEDGDDMADQWELAHGLDPDNPDDADENADGDSLSNLEEFLAGTDPNDYYNGVAPTITITGGSPRHEAPDLLVATPIGIRITDAETGDPLVNAPVSLGVDGEVLLSRTADGAVLAGSYPEERTDSEGIVNAWIRTPNAIGDASTVTIVAGAAPAETVEVVTVPPNLPPSHITLEGVFQDNAGTVVGTVTGPDVPVSVSHQPGEIAVADAGGETVTIYTWDGTAAAWNVQGTVSTSNVMTGYGLGVGLMGDHLLVGAPGADTAAENSGIVYHYTRDAQGAWTETGSFPAPAGVVPGMNFGEVIKTSGDLAAIAAPGSNSVFIYRLELGQLVHRHTFTSAEETGWGGLLDLDGRTLAISAPDAGTFRIYEYDGLDWNAEDILYGLAPDAAIQKVALSGKHLFLSVADGEEASFEFYQRSSSYWFNLASTPAGGPVEVDTSGFTTVQSGANAGGNPISIIFRTPPAEMEVPDPLDVSALLLSMEPNQLVARADHTIHAYRFQPTLNEDTPGGSIVGWLDGYDLNNDTLSFSLVEDTSGIFEVALDNVSDRWVVRTVSGQYADLETAATHDLLIEANDERGGIYSQTVRVDVTAADAAPSDLTTRYTTATSVFLEWTDHAVTETEYKVFRSDDGGTTFAEIASLGASVSFYHDSPVTSEADYTYYVRAVAPSFSLDSNQATAVWDSDTDDLPDWWEEQHGLTVGIDDADLDFDHDLISNEAEYLAGTDPTFGKAPEIQMLAPTENQSFYLRGSVDFDVSAQSYGNNIHSVELIANDTVEDSVITSIPGNAFQESLQFSWTPAEPGTYTVHARVTDSHGQTGTSASVTIEVLPLDEFEIDFTSPANNSTFTIADDLTIAATASREGTVISRLTLYRGPVPFAEVYHDPDQPEITSLEITRTVRHLAPGNYSFYAVAEDEAGERGFSGALLVSVTSDTPITLEPVSVTAALAPDSSKTKSLFVVNQTDQPQTVHLQASGNVHTDTSVAADYTLLDVLPADFSLPSGSETDLISFDTLGGESEYLYTDYYEENTGDTYYSLTVDYYTDHSIHYEYFEDYSTGETWENNWEEWDTAGEYAEVDLNFPFHWYGVDYTKVFVYPDGRITFGAPGQSLSVPGIDLASGATFTYEHEFTGTELEYGYLTHIHTSDSLAILFKPLNPTNLADVQALLDDPTPLGDPQSPWYDPNWGGESPLYLISRSELVLVLKNDGTATIDYRDLHEDYRDRALTWADHTGDGDIIPEHSYEVVEIASVHPTEEWFTLSGSNSLTVTVPPGEMTPVSVNFRSFAAERDYNDGSIAALINGVEIVATDVSLHVIADDDQEATPDGLADWWEIQFFGDTTTSDGTGDFDGDGLTDLEEYLLGSDPTKADTDGDGIEDKLESEAEGLHINVRDGRFDLDGDGLSNFEESILGTAINNADTDNDGLTDGQELGITSGTAPRGFSIQDLINNNATVFAELGLSNPFEEDTDGDGINDYSDSLPAESNADDDLDGDGWNQKMEEKMGTTDRDIDSDGDQVPDPDDMVPYDEKVAFYRTTLPSYNVLEMGDLEPIEINEIGTVLGRKIEGEGENAVTTFYLWHEGKWEDYQIGTDDPEASHVITGIKLAKYHPYAMGTWREPDSEGDSGDEPDPATDPECNDDQEWAFIYTVPDSESGGGGFQLLDQIIHSTETHTSGNTPQSVNAEGEIVGLGSAYGPDPAASNAIHECQEPPPDDEIPPCGHFTAELTWSLDGSGSGEWTSVIEAAIEAAENGESQSEQSYFDMFGGELRWLSSWEYSECDCYVRRHVDLMYVSAGGIESEISRVQSDGTGSQPVTAPLTGTQTSREGDFPLEWGATSIHCYTIGDAYEDQTYLEYLQDKRDSASDDCNEIDLHYHTGYSTNGTYFFHQHTHSRYVGAGQASGEGLLRRASQWEKKHELHLEKHEPADSHMALVRNVEVGVVPGGGATPGFYPDTFPIDVAAGQAVDWTRGNPVGDPETGCADWVGGDLRNHRAALWFSGREEVDIGDSEGQVAYLAAGASEHQADDFIDEIYSLDKEMRAVVSGGMWINGEKVDWESLTGRTHTVETWNGRNESGMHIGMVNPIDPETGQALEAVGGILIRLSMTEIDVDGNRTGSQDIMKPSLAKPTFDVTTAEVSNLQIDDEGKVTGDLSLAGVVESKALNMIESDDAVIETMLLTVNDSEYSETVLELDVSKDTTSGDGPQRYPYSGSFEQIFTGIEFTEGINTVQLEAFDPVFGLPGIEKVSFSITLTEDVGTALFTALDIEFPNPEFDPAEIETGTIILSHPDGSQTTVPIEETSPDTGVFTSEDGSFEVTLETIEDQSSGAIAAQVSGSGVGASPTSVTIYENGSENTWYGGFTRTVDSDEEGNPINLDLTGPETTIPQNDGLLHPYILEFHGPIEFVEGVHMLLGDSDTQYRFIELPDGSVAVEDPNSPGNPLTYFYKPVRDLDSLSADDPIDGFEQFKNDLEDLGDLSIDTLSFGGGFLVGWGDGAIALADGLWTITKGAIKAPGRRIAIWGLAAMVKWAEWTGNESDQEIYEIALMKAVDEHNAVRDQLNSIRLAVGNAIGDTLYWAWLHHQYDFAMQRGDTDHAEFLESQFAEQDETIAAFTVILAQYASEAWGEADAFDRGYFTGRVGFEIATFAVSAAKLKTVADAAKRAELMLKLQSRIKKAATKVPKGNSAAWAAFITKIEKLFDGYLTTKMCFVAGTMISTAHGQLPIEQIQPGDLVLARDEFTRNQDWRPVIKTVRTHPDELVHLTIDADNDRVPDETITGTGEHPFFVTNRSTPGFYPARELSEGDKLSLANGDSASILRIEFERAKPGEKFTTYNFEVSEFHTYFVGNSGVWVHNSGDICKRVFLMYEKLRNRIPDPLDAWKALMAKTGKVDLTVDLRLRALARALEDMKVPEANRIVLGHRTVLKRGRTNSVGGRDYTHWGGDNWQIAFLEKMGDPKNRIIMNLDDVDDPFAYAVRGASGQGGGLDWELAQIYQNRHWWDRIIWVKEGLPVPNPFL